MKSWFQIKRRFSHSADAVWDLIMVRLNEQYSMNIDCKNVDRKSKDVWNIISVLHRLIVTTG